MHKRGKQRTIILTITRYYNFSSINCYAQIYCKTTLLSSTLRKQINRQMKYHLFVFAKYNSIILFHIYFNKNLCYFFNYADIFNITKE